MIQKFLFFLTEVLKFSRQRSPLHPWILLFVSAPVLSWIQSRPGAFAPAKIKLEKLYFISCHDGDTCRARQKDHSTVVLRLAGIDTPEIAYHGKAGQVFGNEAQKRIESLVKGKSFTTQIIGSDKYKRYLAIILSPELNNTSQSLNEQMIDEGFAFAYSGKNQSPEIRSWAYQAQARARQKQRGLWSLPEQLRPQDPSQFRKN